MTSAQPMVAGGTLPPATVGIDAGAGDELDLEPLLAAVTSRLREAGHGEDLWVSTHVIDVEGDRHSGIAVRSPAPAAFVRDSVVEAAASLAAPDPATAPAGHAHWLPDPDDLGIVGEGIAEGPPGRQEGAAQAATASADRRQGRAVAFPGVETLTGEVTVADVLAAGIDRVGVIGGGPPFPSAVIATRDHVRPRWQEGELVLHLVPAVEGYRCFEDPDPHRCCED
ncbi:hypothetical protein ACQP1U_06115 [Actinomycetota bacterium]